MKSNIGNTSGLSLLELLVGLALFATVVSISVPALRGIFGHKLLYQETRKLVATLERLALAAQASEAEHYLQVYNDRYIEHSPARSIAHAIPEPAYVELPSASPLVVTFYPSSANTPKTIVLSDGALDCTITISLRGRVKFGCS